MTATRALQTSQVSQASQALQRVLPVALPEDILRHIASFLDIDTRRALGFPPRKLARDRYAPLARLTAPILCPENLSVVKLFAPGGLGYLYEWSREINNGDDYRVIYERILHSPHNGNREAFKSGICLSYTGTGIYQACPFNPIPLP